MLSPRSVLLLGPSRPGTRSVRAAEALRRYAGPQDVEHVATDRDLGAGGPAAGVRADLVALEASGRRFDCVLCHDVDPALLRDLLDPLQRLGIRLLVIGTGPVPGTDGLLAAARDAGLRVLGPGGYGPVVSRGSGGLFLNPLPPGEPSGLAVLTQSGNVLLAAVAEQRHLAGSRPAVGWGLVRAADVGPAQALQLLAEDPAVTGIALHAEGFADGRAVLRAVAEAARRVPVVLLHGGTSAAGRAATATHTGSLGTPEAVVRGAFTQAGAEVAARADEWLPLALALSVLPVPALPNLEQEREREPEPGPGPGGPALRVMVVADGGGQATLVVDALARHGIGLRQPSAATAAALAAALPADAQVANPLDVGLGPVEHPAQALEAVRLVLLDGAVDAVVAVGVIGGYAVHFDDPSVAAEEVAGAAEVARLARRLGKPLLLVSPYAADRPEAYRVLWQQGAPVLASADLAARVLQALRRRAELLAGPAPGFPEPVARSGGPADREPVVLDEVAGREWLRGNGFDPGPAVLVRAPGELAAAVGPGGEYALKVVSADLPHKSDAGGVRLRVTAATATAEHAALLAAVARRAPHARVEGVLVTPMAEPGVELLVGAHRDPQLGPCVAVGSGGVLTELVRDIGFRAAPLTLGQARDLLAGTLADRLLDGYRGLPPADRDAVAALLVQVGDLVAAHPELLALDLNPVVVAGSAVQLVDVRVVLAEASGG